MQSSHLRTYGEARLPRYTSYPTAPLFSAAVSRETYADWLARHAHASPVSLYLHIPFCRSMCWYCGCHTTISARDEPVREYLGWLHREIALVSTKVATVPKVRNIHFGGGTPTIMSDDNFRALMGLLRERFEVEADAELAIEIDPRTLSTGMCEALGECGINRASLGVQSFDPIVQSSINRIQTVEQTAAAVNGLRAAGVSGINFDLIYGLPHQTVRSCVETVRQALAMRPDRFAVFGYAHVPEFKKHQRLIEDAALPGSDGRVAQALAIAETLIAAGYRQIGLDHFALPGDRLAIAADNGNLHRNFQGYTVDDCPTLIGFGASAIGRTPDGYVQNEVAIGNYGRRVAAGELATARGYALTIEDRARAAVIERLMCDLAADIPAICAAHAFDPDALLVDNPRLAQLLDDGVAELDRGRLRVASRHRFLVRAVAAAFDGYLDQSTRCHARTA